MSLILRDFGKTSALLIGVAGVSIVVGAMAGACALPGYSLGGDSTDTGAGGASSAASTSTATTGDGGAGGQATGVGGQGDGGAGGVNAGDCVDPAGCGASPVPCMQFMCNQMGACELIPMADGPYPDSDMWNPKGDCNHAKCIGGNIFYSKDTTDKPIDDGQLCTADICEGPYIDHGSIGAGTTCQPEPNGMAGKCDMYGNCAECVDVTPTCNLCMKGQCGAGPTCGNQVHDGGETDIDCGGPCLPCDANKTCTTSSDCWDRVCEGGKCQAWSCSDLVRNGQEADVDCGVACMKPCKTGQHCIADSDCKTNLCKNFACQFTCGDQVKNGLEENVDCGGPFCPKCVP